MRRRERPGLLLNDNWTTPLFLFTSVVDDNGRSWLQSQPIRQRHPAVREEGGPCRDATDCSLNGVCAAVNDANVTDASPGASLKPPPPPLPAPPLPAPPLPAPPASAWSGRCVCDPQWMGADCGVLALLPADPEGGYQRPGSNQWGGNPFRDVRPRGGGDGRYHVFAVEMTHGCQIQDYLTNSQIVHAVSDSPGGPYRRSGVLRAPFAHAPHVWRDPSDGALLLVYEGRDRVPDAAQKRCKRR